MLGSWMLEVINCEDGWRSEDWKRCFDNFPDNFSDRADEEGRGKRLNLYKKQMKDRSMVALDGTLMRCSAQSLKPHVTYTSQLYISQNSQLPCLCSTLDLLYFFFALLPSLMRQVQGLFVDTAYTYRSCTCTCQSSLANLSNLHLSIIDCLISTCQSPLASLHMPVSTYQSLYLPFSTCQA